MEKGIRKIKETLLYNLWVAASASVGLFLAYKDGVGLQDIIAAALAISGVIFVVNLAMYFWQKFKGAEEIAKSDQFLILSVVLLIVMACMTLYQICIGLLAGDMPSPENVVLLLMAIVMILLASHFASKND